MNLVGHDIDCALHVSCNGFARVSLEHCFNLCANDALPPGCSRVLRPLDQQEPCSFVAYRAIDSHCHLGGLNGCNAYNTAVGSSVFSMLPTPMPPPSPPPSPSPPPPTPPPPPTTPPPSPPVPSPPPRIVPATPPSPSPPPHPPAQPAQQQLGGSVDSSVSTVFAAIGGVFAFMCVMLCFMRLAGPESPAQKERRERREMAEKAKEARAAWRKAGGRDGGEVPGLQMVGDAHRSPLGSALSKVEQWAQKHVGSPLGGGDKAMVNIYQVSDQPWGVEEGQALDPTPRGARDDHNNKPGRTPGSARDFRDKGAGALPPPLPLEPGLAAARAREEERVAADRADIESLQAEAIAKAEARQASDSADTSPTDVATRSERLPAPSRLPRPSAVYSDDAYDSTGKPTGKKPPRASGGRDDAAETAEAWENALDSPLTPLMNDGGVLQTPRGRDFISRLNDFLESNDKGVVKEQATREA